MSIATKYKKLLQQARRSLAFWTQIAKRDFTEDLLAWMAERGVSQARLAQLLDVSPQFVTKVLRTNANLTIETMVKIAAALNCQVRVHIAPRDAMTIWKDYPDDITRFTIPMQNNVVLVDFAKASMRGAPGRSQTVDLPPVVNG